MRHFLGLVGALFCVFLLAGCGKPEDRFIGKWKVNADDTSRNIEDAVEVELEQDRSAGKAVPEDAQEKLTKFWTAIVLDAHMEIDVQADGSFVTTLRGKVDEQGTWKLADDTLIMSPTAPQHGKSSKVLSGHLSSGQLCVKIEEGVTFEVVFDSAN